VDGRWYLVDLPGYGFAQVSRSERASFQELLGGYVDTRERLAGVIWLLDIRRDPSEEDLEMGERFAGRGVPLLVAITKADKLTRTNQQARVREIVRAAGIDADQAILTSAQTGEGIDDLRDSIAALVAGRADGRTGGR
jgi:GTP-binding protein